MSLCLHVCVCVSRRWHKTQECVYVCVCVCATGKHPLQRRHSVTLPSSTTHTSSHTTNNPTNPAPANQAPTTNNTSTTTTTGTSTNGSQPTNGFYGRDGSFHPFLTIKQRSVTSDAASVTGGSESGRSVGPGAGAGVGVGVGVGQKQQQCVGSAAKSALAAAVKEVLLCSRYVICSCVCAYVCVSPVYVFGHRPRHILRAKCVRQQLRTYVTPSKPPSKPPAR